MESTNREFANLKIPLEEIQRATNNFGDENIIGKGGFGNVYRGQITHRGEPTNIAARRLDRRHSQGDVEFWTEISVLSNIDPDEFIVELIGYVDEKDEKIIINRDYANGSLVKYLSDPTLLKWNQRLHISVMLALAIFYIHYLPQRYYIIHRNINSFTILLDDKWRPKLSGFEFSIKHPEERRNQIVLCDEAIYTKGYTDPADLKYGGVTHNSDLYSFGVVLFELLCGRKAVEDDKLLLASLAKFHYENGTLPDIIHPHLWNQMDPVSFNLLSEVAYSCLQDERAQRPFVEQVLDKLSDASDIAFEYTYCQEEAMKTKNEEHDNDVEDEEDDDEKYENEDSFHKGIWCRRILRVFGLKSASRSPLKKIEKVHKNLKHLRIRFNDIQMATNNFSEKYMIKNKGKYVYKAELECVDREYLSSVEWKNNGKLPKRRYTVKIKGIRLRADEVCNVIEILGNCKHRNIETLLGFCKKGRRIILVYEYAPTKSLKFFLERGYLTWEKRLKICLDIAHGLNYLHHEMEGQKTVIHRDICSQNIELDDDWEAKVTGFEKSIYLNQDDDALYLEDFRGLRDCYMDPEYSKTGRLKRESDVYSFGMIMLEMLCGLCIEDLSENDLDEHVLAWWFKEPLKRKVDPRLIGENDENKFMLNKGPNKDSLDTFIEIANQCLARKQNHRPPMKVIIKELEKALSFQENNMSILRMSLEDIKLATQDFNYANDLGGGGFGRVYKGEVAKKDGNGRYPIVAKKLDTRHGQGEKQFYNELQILYEYKHENIITLIGYSNETNEKIIVYEHAPKGSLDKYLSDTSLTWKNRLKICIDFATGLDFLHRGGHGKEVVIHRDIKAANILLFDDWKAKVGDLGLSMISTVDKETDHVIDHVCGTKGYLDPLYLKSGFLTPASDIYSFGVVLFEILCGKTTFAIHKHQGQYLPRFIKDIFKEGKQCEVVFHAIKDDIVPNSLTTFQNIAYRCLDDDRVKRPTSKEVLTQLKKAMEFQTRAPIFTSITRFLFLSLSILISLLIFLHIILHLIS